MRIRSGQIRGRFCLGMRASRVPQQIVETMQKAEDALKESRLAERALAAGNDAVDFTLPNARGEQVSSAALREQGPLS